MNTRNATAIIILCAAGPLAMAEGDAVIHQSSAEVHNVVTQKLAAARAGDLKELRAARESLASVKRDGVTVNRHITDQESLALRLEILKAADELDDKTFDPEAIPGTGLDGIVPKPPREDLPEKLKGIPLWHSREPPEHFKEKNPELYAYYKPLYEENLQNTKTRSQKMSVRVVRKDLLRDVRWRLKGRPDLRPHYLELVNAIIQDEQLRGEILSGEEPDELKRDGQEKQEN